MVAMSTMPTALVVKDRVISRELRKHGFAVTEMFRVSSIKSDKLLGWSDVSGQVKPVSAPLGHDLAIVSGDVALGPASGSGLATGWSDCETIASLSARGLPVIAVYWDDLVGDLSCFRRRVIMAGCRAALSEEKLLAIMAEMGRDGQAITTDSLIAQAQIQSPGPRLFIAC